MEADVEGHHRAGLQIDAQELLEDDQMARTGYGQEFAGALDRAEDDRMQPRDSAFHVPPPLSSQEGTAYIHC